MRPSSGSRESIRLVLIENSNRPASIWRILADGHVEMLVSYCTCQNANPEGRSDRVELLRTFEINFNEEPNKSTRQGHVLIICSSFEL